MKYYYKDLLRRMKETNMDLIDVQVADEVDYVFQDEPLSEEDFESACNLVRETFLKADDLSIPQIIMALRELVRNDNIIGEISVQDIAEAAWKY